jgi:tRNA-specific 2-thiouridylase
MSDPVLVAISGGLHSAVTAAILKAQGMRPQGVHFRLCGQQAPQSPVFDARCCQASSAEQAREVCAKLDIPLQVVHLEDRFQDKVVDYFIHEVIQARLPNACVPCNQEIRFEALFAKAREMKIERVATGHRAQVIQDAPLGGKAGLARLLKATVEGRDQSYYLFGLNQEQLRRLMLPLGGFQDSMISRLAGEFDLPPASAGDPQEPCFSKPSQYRSFVEARVAPSLRPPGPIKSVLGTVVGDHEGLFAYQLGQEPKLAPAVKDKLQVVGFDIVNQALLVGTAKETLHSEVRASRVTWQRPVDGLRILKCTAKYSSWQRGEVKCRVTPFENGTVHIAFEEAQAKLMAGQAVVFYEGEEVLGGAWIDFVGAPPS